MENGSLAVTYRQQVCPVVDGCIYTGNAFDLARDADPSWSLLVHNLLPSALPSQVGPCVKLLQTLFRESLPQSVIQAAASLTSLRLEQQARTLLVDVLKEHRDAARLYCLLQGKLLLREKSEDAKNTDVFTDSPETEQNTSPESLLAADEDWDWAPSTEEFQAPDVDDSALRTAAAGLQERIGAHRPNEKGAEVLDFGDCIDPALFETILGQTGAGNPSDNVLLTRVATLGTTALDILRYFADNPGDKARHAENILGYPLPEINRLLQGSLGHYLKKSGSGGWECQPWVIEILSSLEEEL
jgi:hypothetical protein